MASLKFIMDVDDDQPGPPPARGDAPEPARTIPQPPSSGQGASRQTYTSHASSSSGQVTRQMSTPTIVPISSKRRAPPSSSTVSTALTASPSASTPVPRASDRRRSTTSNDSMDRTGYASGATSSSSVGGGLNPSNSPMRPMSSSAAPDVAPVKYTPITGRVSRARKGVPVHICETCRPPKTFTRAEHLRRHQLSHQTPGYACTYPGCDRAFHRPDLLARHQSRHTEHEGGDRSSAVSGGGESDGPSSVLGGASHLEFGRNRTGSSSGMSRDQPMSSNPSAPPSDAPSTPNLSSHAPNQAANSPGSRTASNAPLSPGPTVGGNMGYEFSHGRPRDSHYSASPSFSIITPSSSVGNSSYSTVVDSFQQPRTNPSVFATQGVSLPSLSIPDNNPPDLYHPDASPWASSASDSTYSTPASDSRNPRFWLGRHRSPTGDWSSNQLLSPYPNPTSIDRASLDSVPVSQPVPVFANPFQSSHFSTTSTPNYPLMLETPMTGFGSTEVGGQGMTSPASEMTLRPHLRHDSGSSIRNPGAPTVPTQSSATLITPMPAVLDRISAMGVLNRQKEHLMNVTNSHETFMSGGVGFNVLGEFGGGFGDGSPGGSHSAGGLLAALDLPMTGCGMPGIILSSQQLPRQVRMAMPGYIEMYWQRFHTLYPIVHRRSLETAGEDVLRCAMAAIGTQYLPTKEDRLRGNQLHEHAWQELKRIPQWNLQVMQAILLCEMFARFRGRKAVTKPSKMFESLYSRVLYHNPTLFDAAVMSPEQGFQPEERWQTWIDAEARRRLLTACFITDVHTAAYQQQRRAHEGDAPTVALTTRSAALWEATSAEQWASILASDPEAGIPIFITQPPDPTQDDCSNRSAFDYQAVLALELAALPRLSPGSSSASAPPPSTLTPCITARDEDNPDLDPLTRPRSTPGYSTTSPTTHVALHDLFPLSLPLPSPITSSSPQQPYSTTEARLAARFATCPRAMTYLALHHTPLHDLLAVSGDTWIFSQKVIPKTSFLEHQRRLKLWAEAPSSRGGTGFGGVVMSAAQATVYAARAILAFLAAEEEEEEDKKAFPAWMTDLSDYWALYVCALICWAFGHRVRCGMELRDRGGSEEDDGVGGGGTMGGDEEVFAWLRMVSGMGAEQVVSVRGRREGGGVVGLVRRRLEWDCIGGRSRLYVDAVGVLKKLEEGANWKWF